MSNIARPIEIITQEVRFYKNQAGIAIIEIGKRLLEAKQCLPHGQWGDWLEKEVEFSERTAQNFMRIAREIGNPQLVADVGNSTSKALLLISVPPEEREGFVSATHAIDGEEKTVAEMTSKEMELLVKELEAEREEKERLQSQISLFEEKVKKQQCETESEIECLSKLKTAAEQKVSEAEAKICKMEAEMEELRLQAEQTAIPEKNELERIRQEAEQAAQQKAEALLQKKLKKAKAEAEKAKKEAKEANEKIERYEADKRESENEIVRIKEQLNKEIINAQKQGKIAASSGITKYKIYFESVQGQINQMLACLEEMEEAEAGKMKLALKALCESVIENL